MSMAELSARVTIREIQEWMAYDRIDPIGRERDDINFANLCRVMADIHCREEDEPGFRLESFLVNWDPPDAAPSAKEKPKQRPRQSAEDQIAIFQAIAGIFDDREARENAKKEGK